MAHKVGFELNGVHELKIGKTFMKGFKEEAFHTIRYDFKPASVDLQTVGSLEIADKEVTLNVPLCGGAGSAQEAVFKGNKTPASKDCFLIIDHNTGEIVLERIAQHIRVKKTRVEGVNRKALPKGRAAHESLPSKPFPNQNHSTSSPHVAGPSPSPRRSPPSKSPSRSANTKQHTGTSDAGSMPMLNFDEEHKNSIMSDSSSDSDSNSSSSSDSDSDSDTEMQQDTQNPPPQNFTTNGHAPRNGVPSSHKSPSVLSDLELSEED